MLRLLPGLLWLAALASGCSSSNNGAVVVRWRLVDGVTGERSDGCKVDNGGSAVSIDQVELSVADAAGQPIACPSCLFGCSSLEGTTSFALPADTYRFRLRAIRCQQTVGFTAPEVTRTVRAGEITNLGAIEILLPVGTRDPCNQADDGGE